MAVVRMRVGLAGLDFARSAGDLHECDAGTATRLIAAGFADSVDAEAEPAAPVVVETAMRPGGPERAVKPRPKARG